MVDQQGVVDEIHGLQESCQDPFDIYYSPERYHDQEIHFRGYHGAHFLMIVGADGKNYLGAEVKYQPSFEVADFNSGMAENFLWHPSRLEKIAGIESETYCAIQSRHRGALYSDLVEQMKQRNNSWEQIIPGQMEFHFPAIL
jgi:hypothetical protein